MSNPQQRVESDVRAAMKAGDKERLGTLRMLLAEVKNERIRLGGEVDEAGLAALVRRAVKQRHESAEQYRKGGREEAAAREEREAEILGEYLPEQAGDDEVRAAVERLVDERGLSGPAAIGPVMKEMLARFGPRADGATINRVARQVLAERGGA